MEEITATYDRERIRFANGDDSAVAILEATSGDGAQLIVKADIGVDDQLVTGLEYRFYGRWTKHPRHGQQFQARTYVKVEPHNRTGIIRYLMQCPHVGRMTAGKLWEKFSGQSVRILREQPDVAACAVGGQFSQAKAMEAAAYLEQERAMEATTIDLMDVLEGRGFPRNTGKRAVAEWGNRAAELIRHNPYLLMRFRGCGFLRTDQLYMDMGGRPDALKRQALCAWHSIARDNEGHTWHAPSAIEAGLTDRIAGATVRPIAAAKLAIRGRLLAARRDTEGRLWLAEARKAQHEADIATRVRQWLSDPSGWPSVASMDVSEHQAQRLAAATCSPLAIFCGGPGTGKTYGASRLIDLLLKKHGSGAVAVCAPTGKAAVRISEVMQGYGLDVKARTIHSLLRVASRSEGDGWGFEHGTDNPLPYQFIVVDEASMIDVDLFASLCRACGPGTHLLLVGDTGQLPPVGHGAPLRDLIAAGVPSGELTELWRNSGRIVEACHQVRRGEMFHGCASLNPEAGHNLKILPAVSSAAALEQIVRVIRFIGGRRLADPIWGVQVIVAVNAKSELSRAAVNERLQRELNPGGQRAAGNPFRVGDKIVCLKNGFYPAIKDAPEGFNVEKQNGKVFVANGEQAAVKIALAASTIAQLSSPPRLILIPRGGQQPTEKGGGDNGQHSRVDDSDSSAAGCQWDLAYAISCHKSQGSEWPVVIVALDEYPGARMVCSREWLYTAASRAKLACLMVGKEQTAFGMIQRQAIQRRKTFLKELITC